jgi:hypothetical protein
LRLVSGDEFSIESLTEEELHGVIAEFNKQLPDIGDFVDVNDFEKFAQSSDLMKQFQRSEIRQTMPVTQCASLINFKHSTTQITDHKINKGGLFSESSVVYSVQTEIPGQLLKIHVQRTDEDFFALRKMLVK